MQQQQQQSTTEIENATGTEGERSLWVTWEAIHRWAYRMKKHKKTPIKLPPRFSCRTLVSEAGRLGWDINTLMREEVSVDGSKTTTHYNSSECKRFLMHLSDTLGNGYIAPSANNNNSNDGGMEIVVGSQPSPTVVNDAQTQQQPSSLKRARTAAAVISEQQQQQGVDAESSEHCWVNFRSLLRKANSTGARWPSRLPLHEPSLGGPQVRAELHGRPWNTAQALLDRIVDAFPQNHAVQVRQDKKYHTDLGAELLRTALLRSFPDAPGSQGPFVLGYVRWHYWMPPNGMRLLDPSVSTRPMAQERAIRRHCYRTWHCEPDIYADALRGSDEPRQGWQALLSRIRALRANGHAQQPIVVLVTHLSRLALPDTSALERDKEALSATSSSSSFAPDNNYFGGVTIQECAEEYCGAGHSGLIQLEKEHTSDALCIRRHDYLKECRECRKRGLPEPCERDPMVYAHEDKCPQKPRGKSKASVNLEGWYPLSVVRARNYLPGLTDDTDRMLVHVQYTKVAPPEHMWCPTYARMIDDHQDCPPGQQMVNMSELCHIYRVRYVPDLASQLMFEKSPPTPARLAEWHTINTHGIKESDFFTVEEDATETERGYEDEDNFSSAMEPGNESQQC